jgi:hypothetical protein
VPTVAALCGIDVHDLSFEGKSLVPQLFYGTEDRDRIVFAETNAPQKERAAISERWKLIYYFGSNLYELYDLAADPWEHTNLAPQQPPAFAMMKQALEAWMDRVMFVRDPMFNQAFRQISDVVLPSAPTPQIVTAGQTAGQTIEGISILGIGAASGAQLAPGAKVDVHVYFHVERPTTTAYRFLLAAWPVDRADPGGADPPAAAIVRTPLRATAGGAFASDRWKAGDYVRERFTLTLPPDWHGDGVGIGLQAADATGANRTPTGASLRIDPAIAVLGVLPMRTAGSMSPPRP